MANRNWIVVRQFVQQRLGFVLKRPMRCLVKVDTVKREAFVAGYASPWDGARCTGSKMFFPDEAHFRVDAELRGKWVLKSKPTLVDSTGPRRENMASYYQAPSLA